MVLLMVLQLNIGLVVGLRKGVRRNEKKQYEIRQRCFESSEKGTKRKK